MNEGRLREECSARGDQNCSGGSLLPPSELGGELLCKESLSSGDRIIASAESIRWGAGDGVLRGRSGGEELLATRHLSSLTARPSCLRDVPPDMRYSRHLRYSRQGLRALATPSLAYATGCDGWTLRVHPFTTDASGEPTGNRFAIWGRTSG